MDLGADTPTESFVAAVRQLRPMSVLISVTGAGHETAVAETVAALRSEHESAVLVGGAAVPDERTALAFGSDRWTGSDASQVVAVVEALLAERRRSR